ncbi:hypothetical protein [Sphingomonas sp. MM-1]|uniref:hypothetical protein n=1 Tax=Sphingomonas sp. MM-1 TaxID=745310 RepID=UPI000A60BAFC|nr:hypothetical protein [Sphingomonas sp. MM-1]
MTKSDRAPVTQADREAAAAWAKLNGRNHQAANIRRGSCDDAPIVQAFARHRIAALEAAAEVARDRHEQWRMPHPGDARPGEVCDDISACRDIAAAILSLKGQSDDQDRGSGHVGGEACHGLTPSRRAIGPA